MIEINLLPEDLRRPGATPPRTLGVLIVAAVLSTSSLASLGYVYLDIYAATQSQMEIAQDQFSSLDPQLRFAKDLEREKDEFQKRHTTISEIASSRVLWSKKLDRLCVVVNQDLESGRHQVWMDQLDLDSGSSKQGGMKFRGYSGGGLLINVSNFHGDLQRDEAFVEGIVEFTPPTTRLSEVEPEYQPPERWDFSFEAKFPEKAKKKRRGRR